MNTGGHDMGEGQGGGGEGEEAAQAPTIEGRQEWIKAKSVP